jgi:hypothetical protein
MGKGYQTRFYVWLWSAQNDCFMLGRLCNNYLVHRALVFLSLSNGAMLYSKSLTLCHNVVGSLYFPFI